MRRELPPLHSFSGFDIPALLDQQVKVRPDHPFLIWEPFEGEGDSWTYARFADDVASLAAGLIKRGVEPDDKIVIHMNNCPLMVLAQFALARIGAVAVMTNARAAEDELAYYIEHSEAVAALTQPEFAEMINRAGPELKWIALTDTNSGDAPTSGTQPTPDEALAMILANGRDAPVLPGRLINPLAPLAIFYTSGTTARPKGVVLTHANMLWGARINAQQQAMSSADVTLVFLPLFHINAQAYSLFPTLWAGATVVLQPRFSASRFWEVSVRRKATWLSIMTFCVKVLSEVDVPDNSYRLWGEAVCEPPSDDYFGIKTVGWFGMTETVAHPIVGHHDRPNRSMTMGLPAPEYDIAVVRDDGTPVEAGEIGELRIGGFPGLSLFQEYLHNPDATEESFDDAGRFMTGDLVEPGEDGYIRYRDRQKDVLKIGGENVGASEIERVISAMDQIKEVAVVGRPDDLRGELPVAFVVAEVASNTLTDDVLARCREKLSDFKVPAEIRIIDELPHSGPLAKVNKVVLRELLADD